MEFAYPRLTRPPAGDFVYPKLVAWEGGPADESMTLVVPLVSDVSPNEDVRGERRIYINS
jgi:hypothetical protein